MKLSIKYKILIIILATLMIGLCYIFHIPTVKPVPVKNNQQIRIMSYNIRYASSDYEHWLIRKQVLAEQILTCQPDSIGIQEGDSHWMSAKEGLPSMLSGYSYVGVARDDGKTSGEYAAIFYLKDRYDVLDGGTFWLSETPSTPSIGWDADMHRICTWATLKNKMTGEIYTHFNTHFDYKGKTAKRESVKLLLSKIEKVDTPVVVTGDFNFFENSSNYKSIIESGTLKDSKHQAKDSMSYGTVNCFLHINLKMLNPIDFCFVNKDIIVDSYRVDNSVLINKKPVSDHYPLIIDIRLI